MDRGTHDRATESDACLHEPEEPLRWFKLGRTQAACGCGWRGTVHDGTEWDGIHARDAEMQQHLSESAGDESPTVLSG